MKKRKKKPKVSVHQSCKKSTPLLVVPQVVLVVCQVVCQEVCQVVCQVVCLEGCQVVCLEEELQLSLKMRDQKLKKSINIVEKFSSKSKNGKQTLKEYVKEIKQIKQII